MNRITIIVSKSKVLQREIAKGLTREVQGVDDIVVVVESLGGVKRYLRNLELALSRVSQIVVVNTNCDNTTDEIPGFSQMIDFCLYPKPGCRAITIKPYIFLAEILVTRIKSLSAETKKLEASISIPKKDIELMAQLHNLAFAQALRLLSEHLKTVGIIQGRVLPMDNVATTISIEWKGLIRGYEKDHIMNLKLEHSAVQGFSGYAWQVRALVSLFIDGVLQSIEATDVAPMLGLNEGLYAYLISKLVEYGGEYRVEIS